MSSRRKQTSRYSLVEEVDLGSEYNMPHLPAHAHYSNSEPAIDQEDDRTDSSLSDRELTGLQGDYGNILILLFLYILQGIPLGLAGSILLVLQDRNVSYKSQAMFTFVFWPFSLKLLWAPIVDAAYSSRLGRRKSWLVPTQYLIGIFMFVLSGQISWLLGEDDPKAEVNVLLLTSVFFCLYFLAATQDIAVDGWALTMLSRRNVGWASTCNAVGQTVGYSLGNIVFLALESPAFCNKFLREIPSEQGLVTLASFLYFWGIVFVISTTLILFFKHEDDEVDDQVNRSAYENIVQTYKQLLQVLRLPSVQMLTVIYLTGKMGFSAPDSITGLKLIELGVPKEKLAMLAVPMVPIQILLPIVISKYTAGPRPMNIWLRAYPCRLLMGLVFAYVVWWTPSVRLENGDYPLYYYATLVIIYALHQVTLYAMFVSVMSLNAKISDPAIGGTYMTLLNTVSNLGGNWPSTIALYFVDSLTSRECLGANGTCESPAHIDACVKSGGQCSTTWDGYFTEVAICIVIGFVWLKWRYRTIRQIQELPSEAWSCSASDASKPNRD